MGERKRVVKERINSGSSEIGSVLHKRLVLLG